MALSKIELKLGKKVIKLTTDEFEELKRDMRELDKQHHYYWYTYNPYWVRQPVTLRDRFYDGMSTSYGSISNLKDCVNTVTLSKSAEDPPAFTGSILSTS